MIAPLAQLSFEEGTLVSSSAGSGRRTWARPADLAEARLACEMPPVAVTPADGAELLALAFAVVPFAVPPFPRPFYGPAVTQSAQEAFALFLGQNTAHAADEFRVLRGAPDDFVVCARRYHDVWKVGAFTVRPTTLTVRFEDLWKLLPRRPFTEYMVEVVRDPHAKDAPEAHAAGIVREVLAGTAPDVRICLDLAANGGFTLTFWPIVRESAPGPCAR